ncbi:MAG TPA: hypothetical protein PKW03_08540, partial [Acetivibrio sp.]|nr:hypothetical protein [Acetivibrio sp.]
MDNKKEVLNTVGNGDAKGLFDLIASKVHVDQGKEILSDLKDSLIDNIQDKSKRAVDFLHSLKKDKIRNLERLLDVT